MIYVGLAIADSMFPEECTVDRLSETPEIVQALVKSQFVNLCNPSHKATLTALRRRHGIDLYETLPERPPVVKLQPDDYVIVISVRGLPRLTDRHEYTDEEVAQATFSFGSWYVHTE